MKIAVLDIGNSFTKYFIYHVTNRKAEHLFSTREQTPHRASRMLEISDYLVRCSPAPDAIIVTSFGDALMYLTGTASDPAILKPLDLSYTSPETLYPYEVTGYPFKHQLAGIGQQLAYLQRNQRNIRIAPVSSFVAAWLAGKQAIQWEYTHASNSGIWNQEKKKFIGYNEKVVTPAEVIGVTAIGSQKDIPILLGGHDIAFIDANCYVHFGTWTIVSKRTDSFEPNQDERESVRWLRDATNNLCKQMSELDMRPETIRDFFKDVEKPIHIVGHITDTHSILKGHTINESSHKQYEDTAIYAWAHHGLL